MVIKLSIINQWKELRLIGLDLIRIGYNKIFDMYFLYFLIFGIGIQILVYNKKGDNQ